MIESWRIRRWLSKGAVLAAIIAGCAWVILDHAGLFGYQGDDWSRFDRHDFKVVRAISCDLLEIETPTGLQAVHLMGIDGPQLPADHYATESLAYTSGRTNGKTILLKLETLQSRDALGRIQAHVYPLDTDNLNADMLKDGIVYADRRYAHSMQSLYEALETEAHKKNRGLWKNLKDEDQPAWRRDWLRR